MLISDLKNKITRNYYIVLSSIFFLNAFMRNGFICLVPILLLFLIKELNSKIIISSLISSILLLEVGGVSDSTLLTPGIIRYFCLLIFIIYILKITKGAYLRQIITVTILLISQIISIILTNNPYRSISEGTTMIVYLSIVINVGFRSKKIKLIQVQI